MGNKKVKKIEEPTKIQPPFKPKIKRPNTLSTTPDLMNRKPIA